MMKESKNVPMKPLYVCESQGSLLAVMPIMINKGFVSLRIQHENEKGTKKLSCKVRVSQVENLNAAAPIGTIVLHAVDILTPEKCEKAGYRTDGCGYARTLTAAVTADRGIEIAIVCTLCARDTEGHICSAGEYEHTEKITIPVEAMQQLMANVKAAHTASKEEIPAEQQNRPARKKPYAKRKEDTKYER